MTHCDCPPYRSRIATGATVAAALIPKFGCPLCAPLLAAGLGLLGLSLNDIGWLLTALAAGCVGIAALMLMRDRPNRAPALFALLSASFMFAYRLFDMPQGARYLAGAGFAVALFWRAWDRVMRRRIAVRSVGAEEL